MARLNIDERLFADARFVALCNKVSRREAIGMMIDAWFLAQKHWLKDHKYIPENEFLMAGLEPLVACLFAQKIDNGYYIKGSESQFEWLKKRQEDGKKGGIKSAEARLKKYGTTSILRSIDEAPLHVPFVDPSCEMNPLTLTLTPTLTNSNTNTNTLQKSAKATKPKKEATGAKEVIARYCELFEQRYKVKAAIGGAEAGSVNRLVKNYGKEKSLKIVEAYFELSDKFIDAQCHPIALIEKQVNKIIVSMNKGGFPTNIRWLE